MTRNKTRPLPPVERLREYLQLDYETGRLFWVKAKNVKHPAGKEAALSKNGKRGYMVLGWDGTTYLKHRIIYLMANGVDPGLNVVDHINGDKSDNCPSNLRIATSQQNSMNMNGPNRNNKTGVLGVHWNSQNKAWCAKLRANGRNICRFFKSFDDAVVEIKRLRAEHYGDFRGSVIRCA